MMRKLVGSQLYIRTSDTSYVSTLPTSSRTSSKFIVPSSTSGPSSGPNRRGTGGMGPITRGGKTRGIGRGVRGSGLARARPRGAR